MIGRPPTPTLSPYTPLSRSHSPPPPAAPAPTAAPRRPPARTATLIGSPRTAGPRSQTRLAFGCGSHCGPRDVLRLAPPHSPAPPDHGERLPHARRGPHPESPHALYDTPHASPL